MRGPFSGKLDDRRGRRCTVVHRAALPKSPSSAPPGAFLPVEGRGEGKMGAYPRSVERRIFPEVPEHEAVAGLFLPLK